MNKMFLGLLTLIVVGAPLPQDFDLCCINTVAIVIIQETLLFDLKKNSTSNQDSTDSLDHNRPSDGRTCQIPAASRRNYCILGNKQATRRGNAATLCNFLAFHSQKS